MTVISIANQKGGVAKTTTTAALGYQFSKMGKKVLLLDLDPQGNLSYACNSTPSPDRSMYQVLTTDESAHISINDAIQTISDNLDLVPADMQLAVVEPQLLGNVLVASFRLRDALRKVSGYDVILIDTQPSLGLLVMNALTASDYCLIPTTADSVFGSSGVTEVKKTIEQIKTYSNPNLSILGILITRFKPRTNVTKAVTEYVTKFVAEDGCKPFQATIRETTKVPEAQARRKSLWENARLSTAAEDYTALAAEIAEMLKWKEG